MRGFAAAAALLISTLWCMPADAQDWARRMFDHTTHDFLGVARGSKIQHSFPLTNLYKEDVHIASVRSSCGCTSAEFTKDTLKTHETGEIIATFNTRAFTGQRGATITVTFDKPFFAEVQLNVSGYIRTDVVLHPPGVEFGSVNLGAPAERHVEIDYAGRDDWRITAIKAPSPYISAEAVETRRETGKVGYDLLVRLAPNAPVGFFKEELIIVTNDQRATQLPVDVEGQVVAPISVSPASLFLGVLEPGQKVSKQLIVRAQRPFRITSIECRNQAFQFTTSPAAKAVHMVPVVFVADDQPGKVVAKIRIHTDLGADAATECVAYGQIVEASAPSQSGRPAEASPETRATAQSSRR
jgi:hypothetical protein